MSTLPASPEISLTMMGAMFDSVARLWPEIGEAEAIEAITRGRVRPAPAPSR